MDASYYFLLRVWGGDLGSKDIYSILSVVLFRCLVFSSLLFSSSLLSCLILPRLALSCLAAACLASCAFALDAASVLCTDKFEINKDAA